MTSTLFAAALSVFVAADGLDSSPTLTGDWGGLRPDLAEHGVEMNLIYALEAVAVVSTAWR